MEREVSQIEEIVARENEFYRAQTASDVAKLDEILSDSLTRFIHTTGVVDDKASYLESVRSGRVGHGLVVRLSGDTKLFGAAAVSTSMVDMVARPKGKTEFAMRLRHVLFWVKEDSAWRIALRQAVREPL